MENAESPPPPPAAVKPQTGLIKTLGILNILFGSALLLCGLGCLNATAPTVIRGLPVALEPQATQAFFDEIHRQRIADLALLERSATTKEERERLKKRREAAEAERPLVQDQIDFPKVNAELHWLEGYLRFDVLSGPALNLLLILSGIGLVLRKNWGRLLGMTTALLKLVRLAVLVVLLVGWVLPHASTAFEQLMTTDMGRKLLTHAMEQQQIRQGAAPAGPMPTPEELVKILKSSATMSAIFFVCVGAIYPLIALILLSRPGARAACREEEHETFDPEAV